MSTAPQARRRVLSDEIYEEIKELLFDQHFLPGSRLVIEHLAERLGVSPTPVREALARLEVDRIVVKEAHKGYSVAPMLDSTSFLQLYEMRLVLEPTAARFAAERAIRTQLDALRCAIKRMHHATTGSRYREFHQLAEADGLFHETIAAASQNPFLHEAILRLRVHHQTARLYAKAGVPDATETLAEHEALLEAIAAKDGERSASLMRAHLMRARTHLFNILNPVPTAE